MKTHFTAPLAYHSGKHKLARQIIAMIPPHELYCEPFCGSASVFFKKEPSKIEVLNDTDAHLVTFFEVVQSDFGMLKTLVEGTPCSRHQLNHAKHVLKYPAHFDKLKRAWAFWVNCNLSFWGAFGGGYKFSKTDNKSVVSFHRKKDRLRKHLLGRLKNVDFECRDAVKVIKSRDTENTFFFIDPPRISKNHKWNQAGYRPEDYIVLLDTISKIRWHFLLCAYPSEILHAYCKRNDRFITYPNGKRSVSNEQIFVSNYFV